MYKDIKGFPNHEIDIKGNVRNKRSGNILKGSVSKLGYKVVGIKLNTKNHTLKIHRLLAENFLPEPSEELKKFCSENYPYKVCVNHKDGNKLNNSIENLEWCTHKQNTQHAWETGLISKPKGEKNPRAKLSECLVHDLCKFYEEGGMPQEAITKFNISRQQATKIRAGFSWKHIWKQYDISVNRRNK